MVSADLKADLFVTTGNDRVIKAGGQNAGVAQVCDENGSARCIPHHEGHNRMLAGQRFETKDAKAMAEARRHFTKVPKEFSSAWAVDDLDGFESSGSLRWRNRVRVNVEWRGLPQVTDDRFAAGDITAVDAECLPQRTHQKISSGTRHFFCPTAC